MFLFPLKSPEHTNKGHSGLETDSHLHLTLAADPNYIRGEQLRVHTMIPAAHLAVGDDYF